MTGLLLLVAIGLVVGLLLLAGAGLKKAERPKQRRGGHVITVGRTSDFDRANPSARAAFKLWASQNGLDGDAILNSPPMAANEMAELDSRIANYLAERSQGVGVFAAPSPEQIAHMKAVEAEYARSRPFRDSEVMRWHDDKHARLSSIPASQQKSLALELVSRSAEVIPMFRQAYPTESLPSHEGFRRLAIEAEKAGELTEAIAWCQRAKQEGWRGDWDKRIERCQGKAAKQKPN